MIKKEDLGENLQTFLDLAEKQNWIYTLYEEDNNEVEITLSCCSPCGQNFNMCFSVNKDAEHEEISNAIYDYYDSLLTSFNQISLWVLKIILTFAHCETRK